MKFPTLETIRAKRSDEISSYFIASDSAADGIHVWVDNDPAFPEPFIEIEDDNNEGITLTLAQAKVVSDLLSRLFKENTHHV